MTAIKIITALFSIFVLSRVILRFKDKSIKTSELLFWAIVWSIVLIVVFNPAISDWAAKELGIARGSDTSFFISIIILFYLIFRLYIKIDKVDKDITRLTINISKILHKQKKDLEN